MSSILRISDGFSAEFLGSFSHSQKFSRALQRLHAMASPDLMGGDGGQARDVGQRPTVDQVKTRAFARQHVVGALVQYFTNSQSRIRRPVRRVRRIRDGGPEIRALIAAAVPWLARAMAAETRLLIGHTSLSAAAAAVRTPMIAHALVLHSRHRWKGDWRCLLGRGGPHACSVRQWCVWSSTHSPH